VPLLHGHRVLDGAKGHGEAAVHRVRLAQVDEDEINVLSIELVELVQPTG
jgi:hypothetical protein